MLLVSPWQGIQPLWKFSFCKRLEVLSSGSVKCQNSGCSSSRCKKSKPSGCWMTWHSAIAHLSSSTDIPTLNVQSISTERTARAALAQAGCSHVVGLCRLTQMESQPISQVPVSSREHHQLLSGRMLEVWEIGTFLRKRKGIGHLFVLEHGLGPWLSTNISWATASHSARRRPHSVSPPPTQPHHHPSVSDAFLGYLETEARQKEVKSSYIWVSYLIFFCC